HADMARVPHVVADTGAFLSAAPLQDIADALYTVPEVLAEIRDRPARRRLAALPCELRVRRPRPELLRLVTEFSKKTGDYPSLSAADLQVLALTCQLQAEIDGPGCVRWEPQDKVRLSSTPRHPEAPLHLAGFHLPAKHKPAGKGPHQPSPSPAPAESDEFGSFLYWRPPLPSIEEELRELLVRILWRRLPALALPSRSLLPALPNPFSPQYLIPSPGITQSLLPTVPNPFSWHYPIPSPGITQSLLPAVPIPSPGIIQSLLPALPDPFSPQYPLPAPQGGKHANNPHLVEDQRFPQQRLSRKARQKTNVFDPDYLAGASPFAENDVHSRAAHLQLRDAALGAGRRRLNPNAVTKKFVKRR
ncbi:NOB1 protein, partial [Spizella passerina]|nr:NOB1 protein [Spizella passerina]